ncbi:hypothetical protein DRJ22_00485 [Candidatus Woesearchaeota archaeon]|nr:MAG: hypothetical protein DRJ22_00485 [Candidatus Woesearchaeota archaeon]
MQFDSQILWDELKNKEIIGHGREGLILKLNETECIKVYTPHYAKHAQEEFENYKILLNNGLFVPQPKNLVEIIIKENEAMLPGHFRGYLTGEFYLQAVTNKKVPAIIKEFIPGNTYGTKKHKGYEIDNLIQFLDDLQKAGYTFELGEAVAKNFVSTKKGTALIDCSNMKTKETLNKWQKNFFEKHASAYKKEVIKDLYKKLQENNNLTRGICSKINSILLK